MQRRQSQKTRNEPPFFLLVFTRPPRLIMRDLASPRIIDAPGAVADCRQGRKKPDPKVGSPPWPTGQRDENRLRGIQSGRARRIQNPPKPRIDPVFGRETADCCPARARMRPVRTCPNSGQPCRIWPSCLWARLLRNCPLRTGWHVLRADQPAPVPPEGAGLKPYVRYGSATTFRALLL